MNCSRDLVIIGGGITGLSAAYYAAKKAEENGRALNITIIEQATRLGGKIETLRKDGCVIEKGPDSFLARKMPMIDLARDLGLETELVATNPHAKKTYIVSGGLCIACRQALYSEFLLSLLHSRRQALFLSWANCEH